MAGEAFAHVKGLFAPDEGHFVDLTMTGGAADPFVHVNTVVEIDVVRDAIDSIPLERLSVLKAFVNRLENRRVLPDLRVTRHASVSRGHSRRCGALNGGMTVAAIQSEASDVVFVAEGDGLGERRADFRFVGRPLVNLTDHPRCDEPAGDEKN